MKKLLALLVVLAVAACSGSNEPDPNAPTSFVFIHNFDDLVLQSCVAGYYADGLCHKIANLGDMTTGKYTPEITLTDETITEIHLFTGNINPATVLRRSFTIKKNIKNVFELREDDYANEVDIDNPTQYPH